MPCTRVGFHSQGALIRELEAKYTARRTRGFRNSSQKYRTQHLHASILRMVLMDRMWMAASLSSRGPFLLFFFEEKLEEKYVNLVETSKQPMHSSSSTRAFSAPGSSEGPPKRARRTGRTYSPPERPSAASGDDLQDDSYI